MIVGLGNPGPRYQNTRHNVGFMVLALLAEKHGLENPRSAGPNLLTWGKLEGQKILLVWPQIFMNNSGGAVKKVADFYKVSQERILVVHDEMDLPLGRLKFTRGGGSAGHKGLESILAEMPGDFDRLRFGIGRPEKKFIDDRVIDYVLSPFNSLESEKVDQTLKWAADLVRIWVIKNLAAAQMLGNRPKPAQGKKAKSEVLVPADSSAADPLIVGD